MSYNGVDRKDRVPSPNSSNRNVVDHDSPNGTLIWILFVHFLNSFLSVTEEPAGLPNKMPQDAQNKSHMIQVQPLKRSEMQVC